MISEKMYELGSKRSTIREAFEFGRRRAAEIGAEKVYDFTLGNPSIPAPARVNQVIADMLQQEDPVLIHGYTSAPGDAGVRQIIAEDLNHRFATGFKADNLYMTAGAAASLCIGLKALAEPGDEFIVIAPYFPEYHCFVESMGGTLVVVPAQPEDFQINFAALERLISPRTKAVIINSPNNPSGAVYSEETIRQLSSLLNIKQQQYEHSIFLISDEPYREIVFDGAVVPFLPNYYQNTLISYSYSKSLSLPGERIGYILVPDEVEDSSRVYAAVAGAGRALGYVCAPSLFQRVIARCIHEVADVSIYERNRDMFYGELINLGYQCVKPGGAFYLFPRSLEADAVSFCERAKRYDLLMVPGDDFGCPGHVRLAYCVQPKQIERSLPAFGRLAQEYLG